MRPRTCAAPSLRCRQAPLHCFRRPSAHHALLSLCFPCVQAHGARDFHPTSPPMGHHPCASRAACMTGCCPCGRHQQRAAAIGRSDLLCDPSSWAHAILCPPPGAGLQRSPSSASVPPPSYVGRPFSPGFMTTQKARRVSMYQHPIRRHRCSGPRERPAQALGCRGLLHGRQAVGPGLMAAGGAACG